MTEIPIIWKIFISFIFLLMFAIGAFLGSRVLALLKRVELLQADRNKLLEERSKQSNKLRLKGIEMDEQDKEKFILSEIDRKMILASLDMPEYGDAMKDPKTSFQVRKVYRNLRERIKESLKE